MDRERRILKDRVKPLPFDRRLSDARKRVRGRNDKEHEGGRDGALDRQDRRPQIERQICAEKPDRRAKKRKDQHP